MDCYICFRLLLLQQVDVEMDPPIFIMESMNNGSKQPRSRTRTIENEFTLKEKERE